MDGVIPNSELKSVSLHMSAGDDLLRRSEGLSEQAPEGHVTWSEGHFVNGQVAATPAPGDAISDDEDDEDGLEMRLSEVAVISSVEASQNGVAVEDAVAAVPGIDKGALGPSAPTCGPDVAEGVAHLGLQEAPNGVASLPASVAAPVDPLPSTGPSEHDATFAEATISTDAVAEGAGLDTIDRLTAMEMLHLLKEYKKREFLYVSQISMLEQELLLKSNGSLSSAPQPYEMNPDVFHSVSATQQLALLDPTVHLELRELRLKLYDQAVELQKTKDELKACTFSADSVMGRRLINKCKALQEENADLGKMVIERNLQPLQIQLGILQKQLAFFKQQLKVLYESNVDLEEENDRLTRQLQDMTAHYQNVQVERDALAEDLELLKQQQQKKQQQDSSQEPGRVGSMRRQLYEQKQHTHNDHDRHYALSGEGAGATAADPSERSRESPGVTGRSMSGSGRRESSPLSQSSQYYRHDDHPMDGENGAVGVSESGRKPSQQRHHYYRSRSASIGKRHRHHRPESSNGKKEGTGSGGTRSSVVVSHTAEGREPRKNNPSASSVSAAATSTTSSASSKRENRDAGRGRHHHHHHHHRQDGSGGGPIPPASTATQSSSSSFAYARAEENRCSKKGARKSQDRNDVATLKGATKQSPERLRRTSSERHGTTGRLLGD